MRVVCVIPARVGSTRLPEKPLQILGDEPLIRLVARRAVFLGGLDRIVVATDDFRVVDAVADLPGVSAVMTSPSHRNGTERAAEIARAEAEEGTVFINLQGDEPFVPPAAVAGVVRALHGGAPLATVTCPLQLHEVNPSIVKVRVENGMAKGFARITGDQASGWSRHLGVYGYTREALLDWVSLPPTPAEHAERLEQLRPIEHGRTMQVVTISEAAPPGIDTPDDLAEAERYLEKILDKVGA